MDFKINPVEYIKTSKAHKPAPNHPWKNIKTIKNDLRIRIAFSER